MELLPGQFPERGRFSVRCWAERIFECSESTVNDWILRLNIPYRLGPGGRFVDAADFWEALTTERPQENPPKRGGNRRKSTK